MCQVAKLRQMWGKLSYVGHSIPKITMTGLILKPNSSDTFCRHAQSDPNNVFVQPHKVRELKRDTLSAFCDGYADAGMVTPLVCDTAVVCLIRIREEAPPICSI